MALVPSARIPRHLGGTRDHPKRQAPTEASRLAGDKLKAELARMGITQAWLARQLGVSSVGVNHWCAGRQPVPKYVAFCLSLLRKLHDEDYHASEEHIAWLLNLIVHGSPPAGDAPVSRELVTRRGAGRRK